MFKFAEPMHEAGSTHTAGWDGASKQIGHLTVGLLQTGASWWGVRNGIEFEAQHLS